MNLKRIVIPALVLGMGAFGPSLAKLSASPVGSPAAAYGQDPWEMPPQELNDLQRQGFHDGIEGARKDFENHRQPNVNNRDEYRHPNLPPEQRHAYREGFRRGYSVGVSHLMGGPGPGGPPPEMRPRGDWNTPPGEFGEVQQRGFRDGIDGAQKDFGNHRQPDVNNRDEYRYPDLPPGLQEAYREGFRRGYDRAMAHLMGRQWQY